MRLCLLAESKEGITAVSTLDIFFQQLVNGLILGSFYSLVALGYSMVYGIIKLLNFAHGDIYMVGSFIGLILLGVMSPFLGAGWAGILVAMIISMILVGLLGVFIQRVAYVPMLSAPRLSILITALAVSMVLYNFVMASTSGEYKAFPVDLGYDGLEFGNVFITYTQIILVSSTAILMMVISAACAVLVGLLFDTNLYLVLLVGLIWGFTAVGDSAQFSTMVTETADQSYVATALTVQLAAGFLITVVTIWLIPILQDIFSWWWAFAFLAPGPIIGILAMLRLKSLPEAAKIGGGKG